MDWLHDQAMPRTLPDGRVESPGFVRIYLASMAILAAYYAFSLVLGAVLKGARAVLEAAGVMKRGWPATPADVHVGGSACEGRRCRSGAVRGPHTERGPLHPVPTGLWLTCSPPPVPAAAPPQVEEEGPEQSGGPAVQQPKAA